MKHLQIRWYVFFIAVFFGLSVCTRLSVKASGCQEQPVVAMDEFHKRGGLPNIFEKIAHQRQIRIGYIGGSITEAREGWRDLTFSWFRLTYPQTAFYQVNATIGGTGSKLGVFRMEHDVLAEKPDLLFVEFAVNDAGETREDIIRSMEGIVRKTWDVLPNTDICFVYTTAESYLADLAHGKPHPASEAMEEVAEHYGIPSIHMGVEVARLYAQGKLIPSGDPAENANTIVFTKDHTHPLPESGHPLYASVVVKYLTETNKATQQKRHELPAPYFKDNWEHAKMIAVSQTALAGKWEKLPANNPLVQSFRRFMPEIWKAGPGAVMRFRFKGRALGIYDCVGPGTGSIEISIDGEKQEIMRFDQWCDNYRKHSFFMKKLDDKIHDVVIQVQDKPIDKRKIMLMKNITISDPAKYAGLDWYPANIMIMGDLVR